MSNGITGGIENLLGIDTTAGNDELKQALAALQAVGVPTAQQLTLPQLQQLVQQGVLTPQQYSAIEANPQAYADSVAQTSDTSGRDAQKAALSQLSGIVQGGGSTPIQAAALKNDIDQTNQAMQGARGAITQNAQERGVAGGGLEFIQKLMNEQNNSANANAGAINAGANNARLALDAMTAGGTLGGSIQSQSDTMTRAQADAAQQIAEYNAQLKSDAAKYNTTNANTAQAANLGEAQRVSDTNAGLKNYTTEQNAAVPQTLFNDQLAKANGIAGVNEAQGQLKQKQAAQDASFTGGLIGAGAELGAGYLAGPAGAAATAPQPKYAGGDGYAHGGMVKCYAKGGEVHDHSICMKVGGMVPGEAEVPGDSDQNDTVPANLSPDEIVLPRSIATSPNAPQQAASFVAQTKGMAPATSGFADVLAKLEENGLELRLASKGA